MKYRGIELTRHAVKRYLVRIKGMTEYNAEGESHNIEKYAEEILPERHAEKILRFGDGRYNTKTHSLIVIGRVIPTVLTLGMIKEELIPWKKKGSSW